MKPGRLTGKITETQQYLIGSSWKHERGVSVCSILRHFFFYFVLAKRFPSAIHEWWHAIANFVRSPYMKGHRIVPLGHSAGATAMSVILSGQKFLLHSFFCRILTTKAIMFHHELPYLAMILIEPSVVTRELFNAQLDDRMAFMDLVVAMTSARRDSWLSKEHAFEYFQTRLPWKFWDTRVLRLLTVKFTIFPSASSSNLSFFKGIWPRGVAFRRSNPQMR